MKTVIAAASMGVLGATGSALAQKSRPTGILRYPYTDGEVYRLRLVPGAPFVVELPTGEAARNIWFDSRWWAAESTQGSSRVLLRALGSSDVVGKRGLVHIETEPSDLRISIKVEAVPEDSDVPAALQIYLDGSAIKSPLQSQVKKAVDAELVYARKHAEERARAEYETWRRNALMNFNASYEWGGDFRVTRVVDDKVQTYISVPGGSDRAVIQYVDKAGKKEIVNYEFNNGTYVVQNKVLRPGEKFRLILGKEQAWVGVK